jgi:hypothetical protein
MGKPTKKPTARPRRRKVTPRPKPIATRMHQLSAVSIATQPAMIGQPSLGQVHDLSAVSVATGEALLNEKINELVYAKKKDHDRDWRRQICKQRLLQKYPGGRPNMGNTEIHSALENDFTPEDRKNGRTWGPSTTDRAISEVWRRQK